MDVADLTGGPARHGQCSCHHPQDFTDRVRREFTVSRRPSAHVKPRARSNRSRPIAAATDIESMKPDTHQSEPRRNVKVLLVEDHEIVRKGLYGLIDGHFGWKVCGEAANGKEAIEKAVALSPDVVVIDLVMPVMNGIQATKEIHRLCPAIKIVMISMFDSQQILASQSGANAYVGKSRSWSDLRNAIAAVLKETARH
jgi:CheY-like chemotaxis protein